MASYFTNFVHYTVFIGLIFSACIIFSLGKTSSLTRRGSLASFVLALGVSFVALSHLLRVGIENLYPSYVLVTSFIGSISTLFGIVLVSYEIYQITTLRRKYYEIKAVISNLKEKYYKQEISEEELKQSHANLLKELATLEVKLRRNEGE